jgi:hypothetical protein
MTTDHRRAWERAWKKQYADANPQKRLLWAAKKRSKEQNLPFNIEESDIIIPDVCPYLNIPLISKSNRGDPRTNVCSLDRIIPELGYIKGNIEVISHLANSMKSNANQQQLIQFAEAILRRNKEKITSEPSDN